MIALYFKKFDYYVCVCYIFDMYGRCLESARGIYQASVRLAIRDCLLKLLNSSGDGQRRCVEYIQSLMEHYKSGEEVLVELLPRGTLNPVLVTHTY